MYSVNSYLYQFKQQLMIVSVLCLRSYHRVKVSRSFAKEGSSGMEEGSRSSEMKVADYNKLILG
jgi:hypothetical protein